MRTIQLNPRAWRTGAVEVDGVTYRRSEIYEVSEKDWDRLQTVTVLHGAAPVYSDEDGDLTTGDKPRLAAFEEVTDADAAEEAVRPDKGETGE